MPRTKNTDEVLTNSDLPAQELPPAEQTIQNQASEIENLKSMNQLLMDRLTRVEAVQNQGKLRKWDEQNDADAMKKIGRVPSLDGKDPIVSITRSGSVTLEENGMVSDRQVITILTAGGVEKKFTLMDYISAVTGNSIACQVNDWDVFMQKQKALYEKKAVFQRANGKSARINTVEMLKEIKAEEKALTVNVTLSEDMGKSFTGMTLDIPQADVFNAIG